MIRIGIVGCGRILNAHLQGFLRLREKGIDSFRITALVARREEDAWMFHTRGQGPPPRPPVLSPASGDPLAAPHTYVSDLQADTVPRVYTDYRRLIDDRAADAILDTTPVFLHHPIALAALDAGLHVLTQKPLALTVRAARAMVDKARAQRRTLGTFENARYRTITRAIRWAFDSGLLGRPQFAVIGAIGGPWSPDRIVAETPWRHDQLLAGGGGSIDIGVHHMNILRYVLGEVRTVQALARTFEPVRTWKDEAGRVTRQTACNVDDTYFALATFDSQAVAEMMWSWAGRGAPLPLPGLPAFYGSGGCIQGNTLIREDGSREDLAALYQREMKPAERDRFFPLGLDDAYAILQLEWLRAIEAGGAEIETSGMDGLHDLAAAYAILESTQAGRAVTLTEVLSGTADAYQRPIDQHYELLG